MKRDRRRPRRQHAGDPALGKTVELEIQSIGRSGDGVGIHDGKPVYVPLALPGDRLTALLTAKRGEGFAAELVESRDLMPRRSPACCHFGSCGACRLQHLPATCYRDWKRDQIAAALKSRGIDGIDIRPLIDGDLGTRRKLRLAFGRAGDCIALGHRRRTQHDVVPITECPIALPAIVALFEPLRRLLDDLDMASKGGEISITAAETGLDILIDTSTPPTLADREALAALAEQEDLARVAWRPDAGSEAEPIAARRDVIVRFGNIPAALPSGAFLQATATAERAIVNAVGGALQDKSRIADLFAGCGAISLPLAAEDRQILAIERDPTMVQTLNAAAGAAGLGGRISGVSRDLDREPLTADELRPFDALILDPPRAGAHSQVDAIAKGQGPTTLVMVSCNPATFARDARTLLDAGYHLIQVQPIDAFLYSAEIELVACFEREKAS